MEAVQTVRSPRCALAAGSGRLVTACANRYSAKFVAGLRILSYCSSCCFRSCSNSFCSIASAGKRECGPSGADSQSRSAARIHYSTIWTAGKLNAHKLRECLHSGAGYHQRGAHAIRAQLICTACTFYRLGQLDWRLGSVI